MKYELNEATATYSQEADTWDSGEFQEIKLTSLNSGGIGNYLVLETQRWAMDASDIPKFCQFLQAWLQQHGGTQ